MDNHEMFEFEHPLETMTEERDRYRKALEFIARPLEIYWDDDLTMKDLEERTEMAREALNDQA